MKLGKLTLANTHKIRKPMWNGRKIGIATYKIGIHNLITIEAKNKDGLYIFRRRQDPDYLLCIG